MEPRIVLVMIVRNESRIIRRCLDSCRSIIDALVLCDTGSDDLTVEIVEQTMAEFKIEGTICHHKWIDFGHNRTLSFQEGQKYVRDELKWPLESTYALFLDADMLLEVMDDFKKSQLLGDGINLKQYNSSLAYDNLRLARMSLNWSSICVTHEYWGFKEGDLPADYPRKDQTLTTLQIDDRNDGGCKSDKYERDIRLLTQGLVDEPNNERYMFYIAQSYKCIGDFKKSIEWYQKRIQAGGWYEEVWYSHYMIAECYKDMGNWTKALKWYFKAFQNHAGRAEPLYEMAKYYRVIGQQELGYLFAKMALTIPYPEEDKLFISHIVYDYEALHEVAICGFYTRQHKGDGFDACEQLIFDPEIPEEIQKHAIDCEFHYLPKLPYDGSRTIEISLPSIESNKIRDDLSRSLADHKEDHNEKSTKWIGLNPSIVKELKSYTMIYRTVNYRHNPKEGTYDSMDDDNVIRTRNFLVKLDEKFQVISSHEIINKQEWKRYPTRVEGMEDCRLFVYQSRYWFTCTICDTREYHLPQIALARISRKPNSEGKYEVDHFKVLQGLKDENGCEKNWLPFEDEGEIRVIYDYQPFIVAKINRNGGKITPIKEKEISLNLSRFRGSAGPIDFDKGHLFVIHEVTFQWETNHWRRFYFHRFVWMNREYQLQNISQPFYFEEKNTEFCSGLCSFIEGGHLILTCGIQDKEAKAYWVNMNLVRKMLKKIQIKN